MKFRTTALYFLILLVIAGVYAGVKIEKEKTAQKAKAARPIFTFAPESVSQIEIVSGKNQAISLKKAGKWTITSPIVSDVDNMQLTGLLSTLHKVEMERKIGKPSANLAAFGLEKPSFVVRFLSGSQWLELDAGAQNPVGRDRYAMAGKGGEVFMITSQAYDDLNKSLTDLRRKELFSWKPDEVKAIRITWKNGDKLDLARQGDTSIWKSANQPGLKISGDKVDNLLEGLHWLRAANFLPNTAMPSSPDVTVTFQLNDGKTPALRVVLPAAGQKQATATSSEFPCPVLLSTYILSSIPHTAESLVDRSLLSSNTSDIKKITWKTANSSGDLVRMGNDKWGRVAGATPSGPLKNSWPIESFLAFVHNTEYIGPVSPAEKPVQGAHNSIGFLDVFGKKSSLTWRAPAAKSTGPVDVWLQRDGSVLEVTVKARDVQHMDDALSQMIPVVSGAPPKSATDAKK
jgi:hypothetical protein